MAGTGRARLQARGSQGSNARARTTAVGAPAGRGIPAPVVIACDQLAASGDPAALLLGLVETHAGAAREPRRRDEDFDEALGPDGVDPELEEWSDDDAPTRIDEPEQAGSAFERRPASGYRPQPIIRFGIVSNDGDTSRLVYELPLVARVRQAMARLPETNDFRRGASLMIERWQRLASDMAVRHAPSLEGRWPFVRRVPSGKMASIVIGGPTPGPRYSNFKQNAWIELPDGAIVHVDDFETTGHADELLAEDDLTPFDALATCLERGECTQRAAACALFHKTPQAPCTTCRARRDKRLLDRTQGILRRLGIRVSEVRRTSDATPRTPKSAATSARVRRARRA